MPNTEIVPVIEDISGLDSILDALQSEIDSTKGDVTTLQGDVLARLLSTGIYNVISYGASGDGITDDRQAIQDALDAAHAAGGGIVFVPQGNYLIKRSLIINSNTVFIGAGKGITTITKPATVKSLISVNVAIGNTSVTVASSVGFEVGGAIHLYDTANYEWDSTQAKITGIAGNVISFEDEIDTPLTVGAEAQYLTTRTATATSSFPLLRNVMGARNIVVSSMTLDHNKNANDPGPISISNSAQTSFPLATIHWTEAYNCVVENCELLNASGDAYSDQSNHPESNPTPALKITNNAIKNCVIENASRHAVHLGSSMTGAWVTDNNIKNCPMGFGVFYCAYATRVIARGNVMANVGSGFAGLDTRDSDNLITGNVIDGWVQYAVEATSNGGGGTTPGRLVITNNVFRNTTGTSSGIIHINQPDCIISNNYMYQAAAGNSAISLQAGALRTVLKGNIVEGAAAAGSEAVNIFAGADDVRISDNVIKNIRTAFVVRGVSRMIARGNHLLGMTTAGWLFQSATSTDCVIKDERNTLSTPVTESVASTRLVYEGIGNNLGFDPASGGQWNGITGRRFDGQMVRWNSGGGEKVSIFFNSVGWIVLN